MSSSSRVAILSSSTGALALMWVATTSQFSSCLLQVGTLVSVAPTRDGIVVAADSRSTLGGRFCDDTYKLVEVMWPTPTVVSVPGVGIVFERPPVGTTDLCAWIKTGRRVMDIERFAKVWLETRPGALTSEKVRQLGIESLEQVRELVRFSPDAPRAYAGNNLYTIVVASYDSAARIGYVGAVGTRFSPATGIPEVTDHAFWTFTQDSRGEVINFGLFDYIPAHVLREGRQFAQKYLALNPGRRLVSDMPSEEAVAAVDNLLDAASRTTRIVPTPDGVGIGGPTDILLLGAAGAPIRVRWKGP